MASSIILRCHVKLSLYPEKTSILFACSAMCYSCTVITTRSRRNKQLCLQKLCRRFGYRCKRASFHEMLLQTDDSDLGNLLQTRF
mmetsp:Transcript_23960/g.36923  ORF Transcript_23960/g.36923 Transcript_23960/m.36923 type:complete len:85 (+) Transcript_23960:97-351(+)